jgi:hypothetical protein
MKVPKELQFVTPADYEGRKATEKLEWMRTLMEETKYTPVTRPDLSVAGPVVMAGIAARREVLARSFDRTGDLMEPTRPKIIHQQGSVGVVTLEVDEGSPFTGLLASPPVGGGRGLLRMSLAIPPKGKAAFTPGFGLKILIDGRPSVDVLAMNHTVGQGRDFNMFSNTFTHDLRDTHKELRPPHKFMDLFFSRASIQPRRLIADEFVSVTSAGDTIAQPMAPRRLVFVPDAVVRKQFRTREPIDFREALERVEPGATLYEVQAIGDDGEPSPIGRIVLEESFVASAGGDRLFFRHPVAPEDRIRS